MTASHRTIGTLSLLLMLSGGCSALWKGKGDAPASANDTGAEATGDTATSDDTATDDTGPGDTALDDTGPVDADRDGHFSEATGGDDCDDANASVHPGAAEVCDGIDDDCDGVMTGEGDTDADGLLDCEDYCPIQVDVTAAAGGDGSFARPFRTIQEGIDAVPSTGCTDVEVHPGTYSENIDYNGIDANVYSTDGAGSTTIDGGGAGSVVRFQSGESENARLDGFTVTGGTAAKGAGIYVSSADPTIVNDIVTGNATSEGGLGGGIYLYDSNATIANNTIVDNDAGWGGADDGNDGGGIAVLYGAPTIQGNLVLNNTAGDGGGIWVVHGAAVIVNNILDGNQADDQGHVDDKGYTLTGQGGGIDFQTDTASVLFGANIVTNNVAGSHGGGIAVTGYYKATDVSEPQIVNNVIAFNSLGSGSFGAGLCLWGVGAPTITDNLVYDNAGTGVYAQYANATFTYNDVYANTADYAGAISDPTGTDGNLSTAPKVNKASDDGDYTNDDWKLASSSPLVDAGDPSLTDPDGTRADIGAYGGPYGAW